MNLPDPSNKSTMTSPTTCESKPGDTFTSPLSIQASSPRDHLVLEARSLAMHREIARKIEIDPSLLIKAHDNLGRWLARYGDSPPKCLKEWERLLREPWDIVARFMTSDSDEAVRLRQSTPFAGILTPVERKRIYEAFRP